MNTVRVTFLEGHVPLAKRFTKNGVQAYPRVKKLTSHEFDIEHSRQGLKEKFTLLQKHAGAGCGMLKGILSQPLVKESRAGKTNLDAPATNIVLDIDGIRPMDLNLTPPFDNNDIQFIAEYFVRWLPSCFHDATYIVHASASLGLKPGVFSLHLDFLLHTPVPVQLLKDYLTWLNFTISGFEHQLTLTASGTALRFKLDRTLADNSRIIYIAHPIFEEVEDPIPNPDHRLQFIQKNRHAVDLSDELNTLDIGKIQRLTKSKISYLRQSANLPPRQEKMATARVNGQMITVVTNPDNMYMTFSYEKGPFVYYNINGGDSNAYYVFKSNPTVVYNFKGEPNFLFESADPEAYKAHIEKYGFGEAGQDTDDEDTHEDSFDFPVVFRDKRTDKFYTALFDPSNKTLNQVNMVANETRCISWMKEFGGIPPEIIPSVDYEFRPNDPRSVDMPGRFINRFVATEILRNPVEIPESAQKCNYGYAAPVLEELCPTIHKIVFSIMGFGELEYEHFVNWLSFIVKFRDKTMTAWVCHGTPGTGKGVFMHQIMTPILGERHAMMKNTTDAEEKFNSWMTEGLLIAMDEFNANDSKTKSLIVNKLKNCITEPRISIREMRSEQQVMRNYTNLIFFSNDEAPIPIQDGDRRYNVAPLQKVPLARQHPDIGVGMFQRLRKEVPLFASFLADFECDVNMVHTALENDAKQQMREAQRTSVDEFANMLYVGRMEYFLQVLDITEHRYMIERVIPAKNLLHSYLRKVHAGEDLQMLTLNEMRLFFSALVGDIGSEGALAKLLKRRGIPLKRYSYKHRRVNGFEIRWDMGDIDLDKLMETYEIPKEAYEPPRLISERGK